MPRPSSISRLPGEVREAIGRLRDQGRTLDEILAHLAQLDVEVSRSALGRHVKHLDKLGARLRQSRALAEGLGRTLGEAPGDQVARVNIELLHSFLAETLASADDADSEHGEEARAALRNPKGAALFAEAVERLTKASRHNQDFVERIEKRATEAAKREAATSVEATARAQGLSSDVVATIKASVFGVRA
jgi:hypothetical protein